MRPSFKASEKRSRRPVRPLPSENGWIRSNSACEMARRLILSVVSLFTKLHQFVMSSGILR